VLRSLRPALAGAAATAAGNGLARFAFVPLFPAMVGAGWVDGGQAGALGASTLLGYLIGVLAGRSAGRQLGVPRLLDAGMAIILVALVACAWNGGFIWLAFWRALAGVGGGLLMALAGPASQASVPPNQRGLAGGVVIAGVGIGIGLGAILVPLFLGAGVTAAWLGLAVIVAMLWRFAHPRWPDMPLTGAAAGAAPRASLLMLTYGLHAAGMLPPMVYLADLAARGRGLGVSIGSAIWLVFGLAGIAGGILSGRVTDRFGGRPTLVIWLFVQNVALGLALIPYAWAVLPAAAGAGFAAIGVTTVTLSVAREWAGPMAGTLWVRATAVFALVQTLLGFALAAVFAATAESHAAVFGCGFLASCAALIAAEVLRRSSQIPRW
jgi:MFS family permease